MIKQDILEDRHNTIILALGSNLGNRADNIENQEYVDGIEELKKLWRKRLKLSALDGFASKKLKQKQQV